MNEDDFRNEVFKLSPRIAAALNGPAAGTVSAGLGALAKSFTNSADLPTALDVLKSDPTKLSTFEGIVTTAAGPVAQPLGNQSPKPGYLWVSPLISGTVLIGFFFMLYFLLHVSSTTLDGLKEIQNVLFTLLGALGAAFTQVVNYWLGSSKGSADKTNLLASQKQAS